MTHAPQFTSWLDAFFASYYQHRPVNATFVGVHDYDNRLPDLSAAGVAAMRADADRLLEQLAALPDEPLTEAETLDRTLAEGFLRIQQWELGSPQFATANPSVYTGEAAFGVLSLLRRPFAPFAERLAHAAARMNAVPRLLEQGRASIAHAPRAWIERALDECTGLRALFTDGVPQIMQEHHVADAAAGAAANRAAAAVDTFQAALEAALPTAADDGYACGPDALALYLRYGHFVDQSAAEIAAHAEAVIAECRVALEAGAAALGLAVLSTPRDRSR